MLLARFFADAAMLTPEEFEAALDHYLAGDAPPSQPQVALLQRWSEQLDQPELSPLSAAELVETRRRMWARIQALTASSTALPAPS